MLKFSRTWLALSISTALCVGSAQAETSVQENASQNQGSTSKTDLSPELDTIETEDDSALELAGTPIEPADELVAFLSAAKDQTFDLTAQCLAPIPSKEQESLTTNVEADSLGALNNSNAIYRGDVEVVKGNKRLHADTVTFDQQQNTLVAEGNVSMADGQIKTLSEKATSNLDTDVTTLESAQYQLLCQNGRGDAEVINLEGKLFYELENGSITSCPEDNNAWRLVSSSIEIDQTEEEATLYNPRFEVQNVPVFYLPYLTIPIGDTRKTGFLYPTVGYGSNDGFELEVPFYWNLAPDYDLETTVKYMSSRGVQLDNEFRYLSEFGSGDILVQYLANDEKYPELGDRWGIGYEHEGIFDRNWKMEVDYAKVSDINYFSDISSSIGEREDGQLLQQGKVSWRNENWDTSLLVRNFQLLYESDNRPYKMMPQLEADYYLPQLTSYLDLDVISHITQFDTEDKSNSKPTSATRVHIEPGLTIPLNTTWGSWETEARLLTTYYNQDLSEVNNKGDLEKSVTRVLPEFRTSASLYLERDTTIFDGYTQTLEPRVQYLYVPKKDQDNIYNYDTTLLQTDYYGIFRSRKNSSVDQIDEKNQLSYGATSRFYDSQYRERMNLSFGQIFKIDGDSNSSGKDSNYNDNLTWAIDADFNFNDYIFYHGGLQYGVKSKEVELANSTIEYRQSSGYIQANYRYVTRQYLESTVTNSENLDEVTNDGISQIGLLGGYRFDRNWNMDAQYFYDATESITLESLARLTYTSDCWYISVTYTKQLRSWEEGIGSRNPGPDYEDNVGLNFGIIGFGTRFGMSSDDVLDGGGNALGYSRPFYLNN